MTDSPTNFTPSEPSTVHHLAAQVVEACTAQGLRLGTAESTTGGLLGHLLVSVPGASKVFIGGVVAYHGHPKMNLLHVERATLKEYGSVNTHTTLAMAEGALEQLEVDIALAESGIASPTDNPDRPGGLYSLTMLHADSSEKSELVRISGDRSETMYGAAEILFGWVLEHIQNS